MKKTTLSTTLALFLAVGALAAPSHSHAWFITGFEKVWEDDKEWVEEITGMVFVKVPGGQFRMGSPDSEKDHQSDEGPVHTVSIDSFWMGKYEVTNAQFRRFRKNHDSKDYNGHSLNGDEQPAVYVSWNDAVAFVDWLNSQNRYKGKVDFFLPSEAQWEYACRAGTNSARFWGEDSSSACVYANVSDYTARDKLDFSYYHECEDYFAVTAPTTSDRFQPNSFGLYHMLGNVWEWCRDTYDSDAYKNRRQAAPNPVVEAGGSGDRVSRGGSWLTGPAGVRCAGRRDVAPGYSYGGLGFRLGGKNITF